MSIDNMANYSQGRVSLGLVSNSCSGPERTTGVAQTNSFNIYDRKMTTELRSRKSLKDLSNKIGRYPTMSGRDTRGG
jgi:hypothetical protein